MIMMAGLAAAIGKYDNSVMLLLLTGGMMRRSRVRCRVAVELVATVPMMATAGMAEATAAVRPVMARATVTVGTLVVTI
jgi:hypothetical protein